MYCSNCGSYASDNQSTCTSCGRQLSGFVIPPEIEALPKQFIALTEALMKHGGVSVLSLLNELWKKMDNVDRVSTIEAIVERIIVVIPKGAVDVELKAMLKAIAGDPDSPNLILQDPGSRKRLSRAISVHFARLITQKEKKYEDQILSLLTEASLLEAVKKVAKEEAEKHREGIQSLIRDRMATEMESVVNEAVATMAKEAIDNVRAKKS